MQRAFAVLKWVPAVLCGLLVVGWVVSWFGSFLFVCPGIEGVGRVFHVGLRSGNLNLSYDMSQEHRRTSFKAYPRWKTTEQVKEFDVIGKMRNEDGVDTRWRQLWLPFPFLLTVALPLALWPFFRFPLWSYFVWTAWIAAELAFYLGPYSGN